MLRNRGQCPMIRVVTVLVALTLEGISEEKGWGQTMLHTEKKKLKVTARAMAKRTSVYWTVQQMREADVRAFAVTCIQSCAMMAPDEQYAQFQEREEGSEQDRWFLMEKPGLKLLAMLGLSEDVTDE
ncbi:hypothetical protein C8J57DRAFT_1459466 [Mycena rebaudengoi]|nr:hypothetical protein C8J57DRAFT_1459466 [Mycena rebaudengoi]